MPEIYLGIDAGTSSVKVCAFTAEGELKAKAHRLIHVITPYPRWAEVDLEQLWEAMVEAIADVSRTLHPVEDRIVALGFCVACPTTIFLDAEHRPVRPAISYLDRRSDAIIQKVAGRLGGTEQYGREIGNRPGSSVCWAANIAWVRENEPAVWEKVRYTGVLGSYLTLRLTGQFACDLTQASYSGLFRVASPDQGWCADLMDVWQVEEASLPRLAPSYQLAGTLTDEAAKSLNLQPGVAVAVGSADTAAAAFAVGMRSAGDVFESVGTSGVITFCLDAPEFDDAYMHRCHILPDRWLAHGAMSTLGGAFGWMKNKVWPEINNLAALERLAAESAPGANGIVFLPYLAGERSPIWDAEASGAWVGLKLENGRADMVRAAFEGTAFGLRQILHHAEQRWGWKPASLLAVGGGARSQFWAQIKADILNLDYLISDMPDAAAWGAALLGILATGRFDGPDDPRLHFIVSDRKPIRPGPEERRRAYDKAFAVFDSLYPALRDVMHNLSRE